MMDRIIIMIVLIALSGFFSGVETALFSLGSLRVKHMLKNKRRNAELLQRIKNRPHDLLTTILIGNNVVNIAASALATLMASEFFQSNVVGIVTGVMTLVILIFGEVTPKRFALRHNETIGLLVARPINLLMIILLPIVRLLDVITGLKKKGISKPIVTEEELKTMIEVGEEVGQIKASEKRMINRIFKFDDLDAANIMTARPYMHCVNINTKIKDLWKIFEKVQHTKLPVYERSKDHIKGVIYLIDALKYKNQNASIEKIIRKAYFVPESKKVDSLLKAFQARQHSIAIVVDEHGVVTGLVTMEDVLEEIVGEIVEETDKINPNIKKIGRNTWRVLGKTDIEEVNKRVGTKFKEEADFETIGGYILNKIGKIPQEGEEIEDHGCKVSVEKVENNRILEVRIKKR